MFALNVSVLVVFFVHILAFTHQAPEPIPAVPTPFKLNSTINASNSTIHVPSTISPPPTVTEADNPGDCAITTNPNETNYTNSNNFSKTPVDDDVTVVADLTPPNIEPTDTELSDLMNVPTQSLTDDNLLPNEPKIDYSVVDRPDQSIELIDDGDDTEDELRMQQKSSQSERGVALIQGQMAAVLAGIFVSISVVGYVALLSWRRYLENRYSGREMLVDEFEFNEREENHKYFSGYVRLFVA